MSRRRKRNNISNIEAILYVFLLPIILLGEIIKIIISIIKKSKKNNTKDTINEKDIFVEEDLNNNENYNNQKTKYKLKTQTITNNEMYFLNIINKHFSDKYLIKDQVPLSSIIEKEKSFKNEYQNELNRIIDIGIFNKQTTAPLLLIEINDSTHEQYERKQRDIKVKNICEQAGIKLITFWTNKENKEDYVVNRIKINLE